MQRVLQKMVAYLLTVGLIVSGPISSQACMGASDHATAHENHAVQQYADLAIDPAEDECSHAAPGTTHSHDDGLCNKCCAACVGASLIPTGPVALWGVSVVRDTLLTRDDILIARPVPTEPGIPKPV
jgi:hypothetical protein